MARGWGREEDFAAEREDVPPGPSPRSAYITPEGYSQLKAEYDQLFRVRRPEVVRALAAARPKATVPKMPNTFTARKSCAKLTGAYTTFRNAFPT